jgi:hypothetical protein
MEEQLVGAFVMLRGVWASNGWRAQGHAAEP